MTNMVSTTEVAKHAGVSQTTVSRVLNRPEQVKKETYDKVMQALAELDYGNTNASNAEPAGSSKHISVIFSKDCAADDFARLRELTESAQSSGYQLMGRVLTGNESSDDVTTLLEGVAGVIGIGSIPGEFQEAVNGKGIVFLQAEQAMDSKKPLDGRKAAYLATGHLAEKGHEQIAWVGEDLPDNGEKLQGYYEALAHHQLKLRKKRIHATQSTSDFDAIAADVRSFRKPTSAFVAASYEDGLKLFNSLKSAGFKVPKDISIVVAGEPEAGEGEAITAIKPPAATQPLEHRLVERLVHQIEGRETEAYSTPEELQLDSGKTVKKFKGRQKNEA